MNPRAMLHPFSLIAALVLTLPLAAGCKTESFCFDQCGETVTEDDGGTSVGGRGSGGVFNISGNGNAGFSGGGTGPGDGGQCLSTELCNNVDDDCNGMIDDNIDFTDPRQCGNCANNCIVELGLGVDPASITCTPPAQDVLGVEPGTCAFGSCAQDFYDLDGDPENGCEYECFEKPAGETCNGQDDDCDGDIDEGFDLCSDVQNCGRCGLRCSFANATGQCVYDSAAGPTCNEDTTECQVDECDDGWHDVDGDGRNGCEYSCTPTGPEVCDGLDNDCDGKIDNADSDLAANQPEIGEACFGSDKGVCAEATHQGVKKCIAATITCCDQDSNNQPPVNPALPPTGLQNGICEGQAPPFVLRPDEVFETCNSKDDDCDGVVDDSPTDVGQTCGSSVGICSTGTMQCVSGTPTCVGATQGRPEECNGIDDDCDGVIDGRIPNPASPRSCTSNANCSGNQICQVRSGPNDRVCVTPVQNVGNACSRPPDPPCVNATGAVVACGTAGATPVPQPCSAGALSCVGGTMICQGAVTATQTTDKCGEDTNCNGTLDNQPDLQSSLANCGACGNDCRVSGDHINWQCNAGMCRPQPGNKCQPGFIDCDSNANDCERACIPSGTEQCNDNDDDCDCQVDETADLSIPTSVQVCGVAPSATATQCTTGVGITCQGGGWQCNFPSGFCTGGNCSATTDSCDNRDNNCNGVVDEGFQSGFRTTRYLGQPCFSDDGLPPPGHGVCQGSGAYVCNAAGTDTRCTATFNGGAAGTESCNGQDDDCDGVVDEAFNHPTAAGGGNFVKPAVVQVGSVWMYAYEASRPNASLTTPGSGNGYHTAAPANTTLDRTISCSVRDRVPWFNVTPDEASQTCIERGGRLCTLSEWQNACRAQSSCTWGYTTGCTSPANYTSGPFCNLHSFDFVSGGTLDDGLLPTRSSRLNNCASRYNSNNIYDITGNLREITRNGSLFTLMGGAFNTVAESGASCNFTFYTVNQDFRLYDTGFRCCFTQNPSP